MSDLTSIERETLRHSLGLNRSKTAYRNYFVTGPGSTDYPVCRGLVKSGLMTESPGSEMTGGDALFRVTEAGRQALEASQ